MTKKERTELIFSYGEICFPDMTLYSITIEDSIKYGIFIESNISFDSVNSLLIFYGDLRDNLREFLLKKYGEEYAEVSKKYILSRIEESVYNSIGLSIIRRDNKIFSMPHIPEFSHILEAYEWICKLVIQIEENIPSRFRT